MRSSMGTRQTAAFPETAKGSRVGKNRGREEKRGLSRPKASGDGT